MNLPIIPADEFLGVDNPLKTPAPTKARETMSAVFEDEREYRFCKKIIEQPLLPSSQYPKLVGIGIQTAVKIRKKLIAQGYIKERAVDSSGRGRSTLLVEATPAGIEAVDMYEKGGN